VSIHNPIPKFISYKVEPASAIEVTVAIGDGQTGGWAIGFGAGDVQKGSGNAPVRIGAGGAIKGRTLQVVATVVDVRPETNRLSAIVTVSGGPAAAVTVVQSYDAGSDGDVAILTTLVDFV
jgi:hypothetical protein